MRHYDSDIRHGRFVHESLLDINNRLKIFNLDILICHNESDFIFEKLIENYTLRTVFSYEEISKYYFGRNTIA